MNSELNHVVLVFNDMAAVLSLLVVPIAVLSAVIAILSTWKNKNLTEMLPLISI
jgi:hypothetical protein